MVTLKLLLKTIVSFYIMLSLISCENMEKKTDFTYQDTALSANFVAQPNINRIATAAKIQGVWYSSKSGNKYKWEFNGNKLSKNLIYSFGEAGEPQSYQIDFLNGFDGKSDEFGNYICLFYDHSKKGISYQILKITEQEIVLQSKFKEKIVLKSRF